MMREKALRESEERFGSSSTMRLQSSLSRQAGAAFAD